jgi:predicted membrane protein
MNEQQTSYRHSVNIQFGENRRVGFGFWFGIILVIVGAGSLLDAFGIIEFSDLLSTWWPSLLMLVAIGQIVSGSGSIMGSGVLFTIGAVFQLSELDYLPGGFWSAFWPIILIIIGLSLVSSRWKKKRNFYNHGSVGTLNIEGSRIDRTAFFTGVNTRVASKDFIGGELTAVFGGIEVDLRECGIEGNVAHISLTAIFGGIELHVPPSWRVVVKGTPIFGGIDDKSMSKPLGADAPTLVLDCTVIFGGIEVN